MASEILPCFINIIANVSEIGGEKGAFDKSAVMVISSFDFFNREMLG